MNRTYQLSFCKKCQKRLFTTQKGIVCSITNEYATFDDLCKDYVEDPIAKEEIEKKKLLLKNQEIEEESLGLSFLGVKNGIIAGQIAIFGAILWFILGIIYLNRIFFYPFILIIIGGIAWSKGIKRRNQEKT